MFGWKATRSHCTDPTSTFDALRRERILLHGSAPGKGRAWATVAVLHAMQVEVQWRRIRNACWTLEDKVNWLHSKYLTRVLVLVAVWTLVLATPAGAQTRVSAGELTSLKALGSKSAPITVEVFSDFQCPSCRTVYQSVMRPVIDNYVSVGKVYLVHRDFPLPMHKYSREAARWANAAAQIGKFDKEVALGQSRRVNQTPMVFVTHAGETTQLPPGGVTYSLMKQYFDYLLRP